jgi:hypothetical protein
MESRLHQAGIRTFARLAALSPDKIATLIPGLSAERVASEGWIRQARKLIPIEGKIKAQKRVPVALESHQHYENFTVEFLLNEKNETRRTRLVHVQSGDIDTWSGWDAERLIDFLTRHTGTHPQVRKSVIKAAIRPEQGQSATTNFQLDLETGNASDSVKSDLTSSSIPVGTSSLELAVQTPPVTQTAQLFPPKVKHKPDTPTKSGSVGVPRLLDLITVPTNTNRHQTIIQYGQSFETQLRVDLSEMEVRGNPQIRYSMSIYARALNYESYQLVSQVDDCIEFSHAVTLSTNISSLPRGLYRLEAKILFSLAVASTKQDSGFEAWIESNLLQIF